GAAAFFQSVPHIEFVLVGDGPERLATVAQAHQAGLSQVQFREWVAYPDLGNLIADSDICMGIFGATSKAQMVIPNKVFQAAMVGRPIITADSPAVREVFRHGETAWFCPPGDAGAVAEAVRTLAADAGLRQRIGCQAATLMAERFSAVAQ